MKKFLLSLGVFLLLLFVIDRGIGYSLSFLSKQATGGYVGHHNYITNITKDDILIFGSSRAVHHYNASMIQDSLGLSCYNCGQDGEGIILFYGWWQVIKKRYHPKMIIYDVMPGYDIEEGDNSKHLGWLKGMYDIKEIKQEFNEIDKREKFKMQSMMYRYNSRFHQVLIDFFHPVHNINKGFLPVNRELDLLRLKDVRAIDEDIITEKKLDSLKLKYFNSIIDELGNTKMVFVVSPSWYGVDNMSIKVIEELAKDNHFVFLDYTCDTTYVHHNELFYDGSHLNAKGADIFTCDLINKLKDFEGDCGE